ncbi:Hypothetical predicted protein [Octopus vulgaris]|uniref:Uncharacterized protein n=1 Tax=Octopus vulgaris TaxID=6645 RepID=A0AA36ARK2_OCTVU|nr:Hypothetical predicted protein [Octopus vulgaris]
MSEFVSEFIAAAVAAAANVVVVVVVIPFGPFNSPQTFQCFIDTVTCGLSLVHTDIHGLVEANNSEEKHERHRHVKSFCRRQKKTD